MKKNSFVLLFLIVFFMACSNNQAENNRSRNNKNSENIENEEPIKIPFVIKDRGIFLSGKVKDTTLSFLLDNQFTYDAFCESTYYDIYGKDGLKIWIFESRHTYKLCENSIQLSFGDYSYQTDTVELMTVIKEAEGLMPKNVIGANFFRNKIVEVDFINRYVLLYNDLPEKVSEYEKYDLVPRQGLFHDGVTIVEFSDGSNIVPASLAFDLGAETSTLNSAIFDKISIDASKKDTTSMAYSLLTKSFLSYGSVKTFGIYAGTGEEKEPFSYWGYDGLIGTDFLCKFNIIFDYNGRAVYLKRNEKYFLVK